MTTIGDPVMMAARTMKCRFVETILFRAALESGFGLESERKARDMFQAYQRGGFLALPHHVRTFIQRVNDGLVPVPEGGDVHLGCHG